MPERQRRDDEGADRDAYIHRAWMRRGLPDDSFTGRPHIAICNTASDLSPCNKHLNQVSAAVKNGIWAAGGVPLDLPIISLGETQLRPTAMLFRNLAAMATEELIRANPIDGVVLLGGCDKTVPSLLMGAASVNLPSIMLNGGPMLTGNYKGRPMGCGTDIWKLSEEMRAGELSVDDFVASEQDMIRSAGHCNTMGTASTMAVMAEALGMTRPGVAGTPAPDSRLLEQAHAAVAGREPGEVVLVEGHALEGDEVDVPVEDPAGIVSADGLAVLPVGEEEPRVGGGACLPGAGRAPADQLATVSYTHLTLPTSDLV